MKIGHTIYQYQRNMCFLTISTRGPQFDISSGPWTWSECSNHLMLYLCSSSLFSEVADGFDILIQALNTTKSTQRLHEKRNATQYLVEVMWNKLA